MGEYINAISKLITVLENDIPAVYLSQYSTVPGKLLK
jgi:hypothetical protein